MVAGTAGVPGLPATALAPGLKVKLVRTRVACALPTGFTVIELPLTLWIV